MKKVLTLSVAGAALVGLVAASAPAMADPTDGLALPPAGQNGVGSDTTDPVMTALDAVIPDLANWNVTGGSYDTNGAGNGADGIDQPTGITATDDCEFETRILGSGNGQTALANEFNSGTNCYTFARSSSLATSRNTANNGHNNPTTVGTAVPLTNFALGQDGLSYAYRIGGDFPANLTLADLRSVYACDDPSVGALIPQDGSGTRADWLSLMTYATNAEVASDGGTLPSCIDDGPGDTTATEFREHVGSILDGGNKIVPHSVGQFIAQGDGTFPDQRGFARLGYINGITPLQQYINDTTLLSAGGQNGAQFRTVYNVVPTANATNANILAVFGPTGSICANDAVIIRAGFVPVC